MDTTVYRHMIGLLMYSTNTRPDIFFVVNTLNQYMVEPRSVHLIVANHVLRYLKGTVDYGFRYISDCEIRLQGYANSD
jgi:predicted SAM-dependent methyltransferase